MLGDRSDIARKHAEALLKMKGRRLACQTRRPI